MARLHEISWNELTGGNDSDYANVSSGDVFEVFDYIRTIQDFASDKINS